MKYSIDDLRKLQPIDSNAKLIELPQKKLDLEALNSERNDAFKTYNAAIHENDMEKAANAKARAIVLDDLIMAKETEISTLEASSDEQEKRYNREEIKASWNDYISKNNALFIEKHNKYIAARKEMVALFLDLAEMQRKAIVDACHANQLYSDTNPAEDNLASLDSDLVKPETLSGYPYTIKESKNTPIVKGRIIRFRETIIKDKLITALVATGDITEKKQDDLISIIDLGKPVYKSI